jgi:hypothetical protein
MAFAREYKALGISDPAQLTARIVAENRLFSSTLA